MALTAPIRSFDLRDLRCPANCVQIMAILEEEGPGLPFEFWIAHDTALDIPRMLRDSGHEVTDVRHVAGRGIALLVFRREG
jgi:TusA-related sulfurtransferase